MSKSPKIDGEDQDMSGTPAEKVSIGDAWESTTVRVRHEALNFSDEYVVYSFPRYLADALENAVEGTQGAIVGYIKSDKFVVIDSVKSEGIPQEYILSKPTPIKENMLLAEIKTTWDDQQSESDEQIASFVMIGNAVNRVSVRTDPMDPIYLTFKELKHTPKEETGTLEENEHFAGLYSSKRPALPVILDRRKWIERRERGSREVVIEKLFQCFATKRFRSLNELMDLTKKPQQLLKSVLNDICVYHTQEMHRNKYELKPEYSPYF
ncbi:hypothetical protein ACOME3_007335 [Neoechinorhynchus agilis]